MRETINYYYGVYPNKIYNINNGCYFYFNDLKYYFLLYERNVKEIDLLVNISNELYNNGISVNTFIKNNKNEFLSKVNNDNYVLIKVNIIEDDKCELNDIIKFNNMLIFKDSKPLTWADLWKNKVDMFESEMSDLYNEYPIIQETFSYYVGLSENAISYFLDVDNLNEVKVNLNHKRITKDLYSGFLYNPLYFIFDYEVRDLAEYIKVNFFEGNLDIDEVFVYINKLNKSSLMVLCSRLLFPSYYYDSVKEILEGNAKEDSLYKYVNKIDEYEEFLGNIFNYISKKFYIPKVEWLDK